MLLHEAHTEVDALIKLAEFVWWEEHGDECPPGLIPTGADLATFAADYPDELPLPPAGYLRWQPNGTTERPILELVGRGSSGLPHDEWRTAAIGAHYDWLTTGDPPRAAQHPLIELMTAWQKWRGRDLQAVAVRPETRKDKRILPKIEIGQSHPDRERGMLLGGLTDGRQPTRELPLFPELSDRNRVPILELVDTAGLPVMAGGKGAPLGLRFAIRSLLAVRPRDRNKLCVRVAVKLEELVAGLYPNGWQRRHQWAPLRAMLMEIRNYGIPVDGGSSLWFPWAVRKIPREHAPSPDELVVIDLALPPGSGEGPEVHLPTLDRLGLDSAPLYRAFLAVHSLIWRKGVTRVPVDGGQWRWIRNLAKYPVITHRERRRLAFGDNDRKHRTEAEVDRAFEDLPGLVVVERAATDPVAGLIGWRVLPASAVGTND